MQAGCEADPKLAPHSHALLLLLAAIVAKLVKPSPKAPHSVDMHI